MTNAQIEAIEEFRYCVRQLLLSEDSREQSGRRYALEMAASECKLLGLDPSRIGPETYEEPTAP